MNVFLSKFPLWKKLNIDSIGQSYILKSSDSVLMCNQVMFNKVNNKANLYIDLKDFILINICMVLSIFFYFLILFQQKWTNSEDKSTNKNK